MIDFNNAGTQRAEQIGANNTVDTDPVSSFLSAMAEYELRPDTIYTDGALHRFDVSKPGDKAGWYVFHHGDICGGAFGNWQSDLNETWCSKKVQELSWEERHAYTELQKQARAKREREREINQQKAKETAQRIWQESKPIVGQAHPYLKAKNIQPHYTRLTKGGDLVVPRLDENGVVWSVQFVKETPEGEKPFEKKNLPFGRCDGLFFEILGSDQVYLCEGFSTGSSIHQATGATVVCSFEAGQLPKVARVIKNRFPGQQITIAADNDIWKPESGNAGIKYANEAAKILGCSVVFPTFQDTDTKPTDFNDLMALEGMTAVATQLGDTTKKAEFPPLSAEATKLANWLKEKPKPMEFVWECNGVGYMPKGVVGVLAATGGTGKTFLLLSLAVMTAAGQAFGPIQSTQARKTLVICGEDNQEEVGRRLWSITGGKFPEYLHAASVYGSLGPLMELDSNKPIRSQAFYWLEETIRRHEGLELLILDPKSRFYGLDENNNDHATQWVQCLEYLAKTYGINILFAAHTSDANSGKISQTMNRGASALVDGCRWQAGLIRMDKETAAHYCIDNPREYVILDTPKNNYAADVGRPIYFKRGDNGELIHCNVKAEGDQAKEEKVMELLSAEPGKFTKSELLRDKDFYRDFKDRFTTVSKEQFTTIINEMITKKLLIEEPIKTDGRARFVLSVNVPF